MLDKLKSGQYRLDSRKVGPCTQKHRNLDAFKTHATAEEHERAGSSNATRARPKWPASLHPKHDTEPIAIGHRRTAPHGARVAPVPGDVDGARVESGVTG